MSEELPSDAGRQTDPGGQAVAGTRAADRSPSTTSHDRPYDPEELIGRTLAGRYEVERCIGKGGMGVVYLAQQHALERKVVIKVLSRSLDNDDEASGRFEREAVGMSRLHHPNVVSIYDFGHEDDQAYICMEFVDGQTLSRRIKRDGAMTVDTFAHIAAQLLQGIGEAHSLGLVHRDIKPSNIMLTERHGQQDYVKILDFGLAKLVNNARVVTKEQSLVGSTAFLSPEQIMGNDIDQRVDVYALGVLFYYMLTAEKPFSADDDITVLYQHVHHPPPPLVDMLPDDHRVPRELVELIERMLAKEPDHRPLNAGEVHDELAAIMANISSIDMSGWEVGEASAPVASDKFSSSEPREQSSSGAGGPASVGGHASGSHPSGHSFVTDEQMLAMQKATTRRTMIIVLVAFLVFVGGLGAFWILRDTHASAESIEAEIARAEQLVDQGKLGRAESVLELTRADIKHHPALKERFAASQDRLVVAKLLADARFHEEQGKLQGAIDDYRQVLSRNPDHQEAKSAIKRLLAELEHQEVATSADGTAKDQEPVAPPSNDKPSSDEPSSDKTSSDEPSNDKPAVDDSATERPKKSRATARARQKRQAVHKEPAVREDRPASAKGREPRESPELLLPIDDQKVNQEVSNDDVQLLPIE